jgi:hypothetical protein
LDYLGEFEWLVQEKFLMDIVYLELQGKIERLEQENERMRELLIEACEIIKYGGLTTRNPSAYDLLNKPEINQLLNKGGE